MAVTAMVVYYYMLFLGFEYFPLLLGVKGVVVIHFFPVAFSCIEKNLGKTSIGVIEV